FGNQDDMALVPISTMETRLSTQRTARGARNVNTINVQAVDQASIKAAVEQVGDILRERHKTAQDDFTVQSQEDLLQVAGQITGVMTLLLGAIAGISLVVGGIGIMNIMLVSVTERTREIGIRKAIGARRRDILAQFLTEAIVVSVLGGAVGVGLGIGIAQMASGIDLNGQRLQTLVGPDSILLAFGVSAAIGLFFGSYPAMRAARLNPIEALRYE
ncbi:MAG TPA: FtsX-like permease family protein, partial [Chloroflexota bacterium]